MFCNMGETFFKFLCFYFARYRNVIFHALFSDCMVRTLSNKHLNIICKRIINAMKLTRQMRITGRLYSNPQVKPKELT